MADVKVSALPLLAAASLDPAADYVMVADMSASASKRMYAGELIRAALPYLATYYDFTLAAMPVTTSFTRASTGWRFNSSGVLVPETTDAPRFQYDPSSLVSRGLLVEEAATNGIRNSTMQGAVAGIPGTAPTNWTLGGLAGLSSQIVGFGTTSGIDYIDIRYFGTTNTTGGYLASFDTTSGIASANGQTWTESAYLALVAGAFTNITNLSFNMVTYPGGGSAGNSNVLGSINGTLNRLSMTCTVADVSNTNVQPRLSFNCTNGAAVDFTLRMGLPQTVQQPATSSLIRTTGTAATRAEDVARLTNAAALSDQVHIVRARTASFSPPSGVVQSLFQVDDGTANNRRTIRRTSDNHLHVIATVGGVDQCDLDLGTVANSTDFVVAARFADNLFAASLNGGAIVTDLSGSNPLGLTTARVGRGATGSHWNSTVRTIETRRIATDAELPLLAA